MKHFKSNYTWVAATIILAVGYFVSCTKDDQVLDTPQVINNSTDLVAVKTSAPPNY